MTHTGCALCQGTAPTELDRATLAQCCRGHITAVFLQGRAGWIFVLPPIPRVRFAP